MKAVLDPESIIHHNRTQLFHFKSFNFLFCVRIEAFFIYLRHIFGCNSVPTATKTNDKVAGKLKFEDPNGKFY